jgi:hypothetical protein
MDINRPLSNGNRSGAGSRVRSGRLMWINNIPCFLFSRVIDPMLP